MKKFLATITLPICLVYASFAQELKVDAGVAIDYSDNYDKIAVGGALDFDYVFLAKIATFSNTDFIFTSGLPNFAIAEIFGRFLEITLGVPLRYVSLRFGSLCTGFRFHSIVFWRWFNKVETTARKQRFAPLPALTLNKSK